MITVLLRLPRALVSGGGPLTVGPGSPIGSAACGSGELELPSYRDSQSCCRGTVWPGLSLEVKLGLLGNGGKLLSLVRARTKARVGIDVHCAHWQLEPSCRQWRSVSLRAVFEWRPRLGPAGDELMRVSEPRSAAANQLTCLGATGPSNRFGSDSVMTSLSPLPL